MNTAAPLSWAEVRRSGIGSSDAAAVCGLSPFATAQDVFLEKTGRWVDDEESFSMWLGKVLEPGILRRYAKEAKVTILGRTEDGKAALYLADGSVHEKPMFPLLGTLRDPKAPWRMAHIDGFLMEKEFENDEGSSLAPVAPIEAKSSAMWDGWGDADDEIPPDYIIQVHHQLAVLEANGYPFDHVIAPAALTRKREFRVYTIPRNDILLAKLLRAEDHFWAEYVEKDMPPPPEYNARGSASLARLYAQDDGETIEADEETAALMVAYAEARQAGAGVEGAVEEIAARLKEKIGAASTLVGPVGKVHWRRSKDRTVTDWEAAFKELRNVLALWASDCPEDVDLADIDEIVQKWTTTKPGSRSFRYYPPKGEKK